MTRLIRWLAGKKNTNQSPKGKIRGMIGCLQLTTNENPLVSTVEIDSKWQMSYIVIGYVSEGVSYHHKGKYFFYYAIRGG